MDNAINSNNNHSDLHMKQIIDKISTDLRVLSSEAKRKYSPIKEACEACSLKLIQIYTNNKNNLYKSLCDYSLDVLQPFIMGCDTKQPKIIQICLNSIKLIIEHKIININSATILVDTLWYLLDDKISEELKILQIITTLISTTDLIKSTLLAKTLTIGIRLLNGTKDVIIQNTANAMLTQIITRIFDRLTTTSEHSHEQEKQSRREKKVDLDKLKAISKEAPETLCVLSKDVYMLTQDLYLLLNSDTSQWLLNINELNKLFALDILRIILTKYTQIFEQIPEMLFVLKERLCPLLIKLLSPSIKTTRQTLLDRGQYQLISRLMRIIYILMRQYLSVLVTENEIFFSLLIKYMDADKCMWQRAFAFEICLKLVQDASLIQLIITNYDMKQHTENILQSMVTSIYSHLTCLFTCNSFISSTTLTKPSNEVHTSQMNTNSINGQALFIYKDTIIQLINQQQQPYTYYLDDNKNEVPLIQDGYLLNVCLLITQELIKNIDYLLGAASIEKTIDTCVYFVKNNCTQLIGILNILMETCMDEQHMDTLFKQIKILISICFKLELFTERDSFMILLCKMALPSLYSSIVLNLNQLNLKLNLSDDLDKHQVVAIGQSLNNKQFASSLTITYKNILAMRFLLQMSTTHLHDYLNASCWYVALNTLQHLSFTLNLRPINGYYGLLDSLNNTNQSNSTLTTAIQNDIHQICQLLTKIFEVSKEVTNENYQQIANTLIRLSNECIYMNTSDNVCLFSLSKLYELIAHNLHRLQLIWSQATTHLIDLCKQTQLHAKIRESCVEIICSLVKQIFTTQSQQSQQVVSSKELILIPLQELSLIEGIHDLRQKQLDCILTIIRLTGTQLNDAWPICLQIIGSITKEHSDTLIRSAFQCVQLIVTDYLSMINERYLTLIIQVVCKFGFQEQDLNVSLTAVVLLWTISDYMFSNGQKSNDTWMCLYASLGELCINAKAAIRKSANQTLFCTISSHASVLSDAYWQKLIWNVLFTLMDNIKNSLDTSSKTQQDNSTRQQQQQQAQQLLMHHSRDTALKQWSETQVLAIQGVTRVFNTKCNFLIKLNDFHRMWSHLLINIIEPNALLNISEIALSSLKGFHELLGNTSYYSSSSSSSLFSSTKIQQNEANTKSLNENGTDERGEGDGGTNQIIKYLDTSQWLQAYKTWSSIGLALTNHTQNQTYLTIYVDLFKQLIEMIYFKYSESDFEVYSKISHKILKIQANNTSNAEFVTFNLNESKELIPLQLSIINTLKCFFKLFKQNDTFEETYLPLVFKQLLAFILYTCNANQSTTIRYVQFSEKCILLLNQLYDDYLEKYVDLLIQKIFKQIIQTLWQPLRLKYSLVSASTWKLSIDCLLKILHKTLPLIFQLNKDLSEEVWLDLAKLFEDFLFTCNRAPYELSLDLIQKDELIDCKLIDLIRDDLLVNSSKLPITFVDKLLKILNRGSIYDNNNCTNEFIHDHDLNKYSRELFSKLCFDTLLKYSLQNDSSVNKMAICSMLMRCKDIIQHYAHDDKLSLNVPLSKQRINEFISVLKSLNILINSLKKLSSNSSIKLSIWNQIIGLYPCLVECLSTSSNDINQSIKETLHSYFYLLNPPLSQ